MYSLSTRLWHWLNALVIISLLTTVLLRETVLNKHSVANIVKTELTSMNIEISDKQAVQIGKKLEPHYGNSISMQGMYFAFYSYFD